LDFTDPPFPAVTPKSDSLLEQKSMQNNQTITKRPIPLVVLSDIM
jgi:hypothetical protein